MNYSEIPPMPGWHDKYSQKINNIVLERFHYTYKYVHF